MRNRTYPTRSGTTIWAGVSKFLCGGSSLRLGIPHPVKLALGLPLVRRGSRLVVPPTATPLWVVKGWQRAADSHVYTGQYVAGGAIWQGLIQEPYPGGYQAFIWYPPIADIRNKTSHGPCFTANGETGRYMIHFHTTPSSIDHAITTIEEVLQQARSGAA